MIEFKENCALCNKELQNTKINYLYVPVNFTWDKAEPWAKPNTFFCSEEHKQLRIKENRRKQTESLPWLAELDESMNYCEYFTRTNWNEWVYKRYNFEHKVNWLWDYKSFDIPEANNFKQAYIKHFWDFNRFKLHNRY